MRLRSKVNISTGSTRHYIGALIDGQPTPVADLPDPVWVEICEEDGAFYLFRLDAREVVIADTWHQSLQEAKRQAIFEFGITPDEWTEVDVSDKSPA